MFSLGSPCPFWDNESKFSHVSFHIYGFIFFTLENIHSVWNLFRFTVWDKDPVYYFSHMFTQECQRHLWSNLPSTPLADSKSRLRIRVCLRLSVTDELYSYSWPRPWRKVHCYCGFVCKYGRDGLCVERDGERSREGGRTEQAGWDDVSQIRRADCGARLQQGLSLSSTL